MKNKLITALSIVSIVTSPMVFSNDNMDMLAGQQNSIESISSQTVDINELTSQINDECAANPQCSIAESQELTNTISSMKNNERVEIVTSGTPDGKIALVVISNAIFHPLKSAANAGKGIASGTVKVTKVVLKAGTITGKSIAKNTIAATKWTLRTGKAAGLAIAGVTVDGVKFSLNIGREIGLTIGNKTVKATNFVLRNGKKSGLLIAEVTVDGTKFVLKVGKATGLAIADATVKSTKFVLRNGKRTGLAISDATVDSVNFVLGNGKKAGLAVSSAVVTTTKLIGGTVTTITRTTRYKYHRGQLLLAARTGDVSRVKKFVNKGVVELTATNRRGMNALMFAAIYNNTEVARFIVSKMNSLQVRAADGEGQTALSQAVSRHGKDSEIVNIIESKMSDDAEFAMMF